MNTIRLKSLMIALSTLGAIILMSCSLPAFAQSPKKSDHTVKIYVEYKLTKDGLMTDHNIHVAVSNAKITLTGTVSTLYDVTLAGKDAKNVENNYTIVNELTALVSQRSDSVIVRDVMHRIETHDFYTVFDWVTAHAKNGVVTLRGWVNAPWYVRQYQAQAERVIGVRKVVNDLKTAIGSDFLKYRAYQLIYSDPFYQDYALEMNPPIHVIVNGASLILEGKVNTSGERGYLADLMRFRTDAPMVVDNLQVSPD
ncbi:MAG: BON domain-containing protein [Bacteroidetes bacterium]|nr:BON domain-containing protein [Bacteroidota bacterium]